MSHRLFVAIRPPADVRDALIDRMEGIRDARWQDDDQLHLTLRYIGEVDRHQASQVAAALSTIVFAPFPLRVNGTGTFTCKGRVHTLFATLEPSPPLLALHSKVERVCISSGLPPEPRRYAPHITLARLNAGSGTVTPFLAATGTLTLGPWVCDAFHLYESHLRAAGSLYDKIASYPARQPA